MSKDEKSSSKLEPETERPSPRPQRPPPPPPLSIRLDPPPTETITSPYEIITDITPLLPEISDDWNTDLEDKCRLFLFEFNELFEKFDYAAVRHKILTRQMTTSPFTTVLWRIFLHCLPRDSSHWDQTIDASRDDYNELAEKYFLDKEKIREQNGDDFDVNHPLSQKENSRWNQYYEYEGLRENINQDVKRTCQEIPFFQQKHILDLLLKVLYIHSRAHEHTLPYRQGMHEILAVIVYSIATEGEVINQYPESNDLMKKLYDPEYLAHDSYGIYKEIIKHLQSYYDFKPSSNSPLRRIHDKSHPSSRRASLEPFYVNKTIRLVDEIFARLKDHDPKLHQKLDDLSIEPTVYGIRWLRLLFGREIPFESIPTLWTVIFCYDEMFGFVNYVFLALLKKIGQLFENQGVSEYSCCLQYLMQPNVLSDVEGIIRKALTLERRDQQRPLIRPDAQFLGDYTISSGMQASASPSINNSRNPLIDLLKKNSTLTSSQLSRDSEMTESPGKENLQRLDENVQLQRNCATFIRQFIDRIRKALWKFDASNDEELMAQLQGLDEIANILEGKLTLDENSIEELLKHYYKEKSSEHLLTETV